MARKSRYSQEVRERAVRMVFEHRGEHGSEWEAMQSIAGKLGCSAETLRKWVRQTEVDSGVRGGPTTALRHAGRLLAATSLERNVDGVARGRPPASRV